jgi:hypothetical protein
MKYIKLFEKYRSNENFNKWFNDSKVVDDEGNPLIVYHGTKRDFDTFTPKEHRKETEGYYFSVNSQYANIFMGYDNKTENMYPSTKEYLDNPTHGKIYPNIIPVYLSLQNPLIVDANNNDEVDIIEDIGYWKHIYDDVKSKGYDGVMTSDMDQIFVFSPTQIKSAYGNNGNFDSNKNSILEQIKNPKKFS